jgi:hypothetical protein
VTFTPAAVGTRTGALTITDNAANSPQAVGLTGTGPTYYVDNCVVVGSDSNKGTSPSAPWLTVNKVNTSTFKPGDSILFESTCIWREQLTVPSSGSAGSPITFGAYGTGAQPIISGADIFSSWITEGSLYYSAASVQPNQVFTDGVRLTAVAAKANLATGDWWWDATNRRIYVYDDPSGHTIEVSARTYAVGSLGSNYITFTSLHAQHAQSDGFSLGGDYLVGNGLISDYNYYDGISGGGASWTIQNSTVSYNGADGIFFTNSNNFLISANVVHHNCQLGIDSNANYTGGQDSSAGIRFGLYQLGSGTVEYNVAYSQAQGGVDSGAGINLDTNASSGSYVVIQYNETYNNYGAGIRLDLANNAVVAYNLSYNNLNNNDTAGIHVAYTANGNFIYNNTMYGNVLGLDIEGNAAGSPGEITGNLFKNNISVGNSEIPFRARWGGENDGTLGSGNVYTYNDFGPAAASFIEWGNAVYYSTYASWESATGNCGTPGCSHSVQADPKFVNASAAQFWLASPSPAIDAGANLGSPYNIGLLPGSSWPNLVLTGDQNSYGTGWEIGAYIFTGQTVQ